MPAMDYEALTQDLIHRSETAFKDIAALAVDTGVVFQVEDIVQKVEDGLPRGYPAPTAGVFSRREVIADMVRDIMSGEMYAD